MPSNSLFFKVCFLLLTTLVLSCCGGCVCESACVYTELASLEAYHLDNQGFSPTAPVHDTLDAEAYLLEVKFYGKAPEKTCNHMIYDLLNGFATKALALSCHPNAFLSPDTIQTFSIQSTADFNTEYPAGSELRNLFEAQFQSVHDDVFERFETIDSTAYWPPERYARFYLFSSPDEIREHRFIVTATMKNGEIFSDTTSSIFLR